MPISPSGRYKKRQHWGASMMRKLAFLCLLPILAVPFSVQALGLGDIRLHSALNQPLDAEIELISATDGELESLKATVAATETFAEYGLERPDFLDTLIFSVTQDASGRSILKVSSRTPVTEPVVTLLIEANWSRGQLLREYTVLLDPPLFAPAEDAPRYVQPAPPPVSIQPEPAPELRFEQPPPAALPAVQEPAPFTQPEATVTTPAPAPSYPTASYPTGDDYGPVVRELISATDGELESLKATVAATETFAEYGLERPDFLDTLIFSVTQDASGRSILKVSSRTPASWVTQFLWVGYGKISRTRGV